MKDKEKLHQILSSLWKNDDSVGKTYYNQALQDVQIAIDSLPEEPVSEEFKQFEDTYLDKEKDEILCIYDRHAGLVDGANWQKEQMMKGAFEFTRKHNDACVLASECLRDHGWFNREHDFNDLFLYLSCVDELFAGKFSGKTKVIVIKED